MYNNREEFDVEYNLEFAIMLHFSNQQNPIRGFIYRPRCWFDGLLQATSTIELQVFINSLSSLTNSSLSFSFFLHSISDTISC